MGIFEMKRPAAENYAHGVYTRAVRGGKSMGGKVPTEPGLYYNHHTADFKLICVNCRKATDLLLPPSTVRLVCPHCNQGYEVRQNQVTGETTLAVQDVPERDINLRKRLGTGRLPDGSEMQAADVEAMLTAGYSMRAVPPKAAAVTGSGLNVQETETTYVVTPSYEDFLEFVERFVATGSRVGNFKWVFEQNWKVHAMQIQQGLTQPLDERAEKDPFQPGYSADPDWERPHVVFYKTAKGIGNSYWLDQPWIDDLIELVSRGNASWHW